MATRKTTTPAHAATAPATAPDDRDMLSRLSTEQVRALLRQIATEANAMRSVARGAVEEAGLTPAADSCFVVALVADRIGAIADWALGGDCVGSFEEWILSPAVREGEEASNED